ncbi:vWA domain-containing protein [Oceaniferula marina]|nr:VWA domain-containing protein [Oceaniferula marina]
MNRMSRITGQKPSEGSTITRRSTAQHTVAWLSWILIITAMARPQFFEPPISRTLPTRDLLLAIDLSGSMQVEDFKDEKGQMRDRLTAVKQVVDTFLEHRENDRVGLILFGSAAFVQAPFTNDLDVCRELLAEAQVGMAGPKTAIGDAIGLSIHVFNRSEQKNKVLILLTDGNDTSSKVPPTDAARIARDKGIVIHTIAIGDPEAAGEEKLDEDSLREISQTTNGSFYRALDRDQLENIYQEIDALDTRKAETISYRPRRDLYVWPLATAIILAILFQIFMALRHRARTAKLPDPSTP